jgi:hypothetical protein
MQPYLLLPFRFDPERLKTDLRTALAEAWTPHFNQSYYEGDWSGVVLKIHPVPFSRIHGNRLTRLRQLRCSTAAPLSAKY